MDIASSSLEELVHAYRRAASAHGQATLAGDHEEGNRQHDIIAAIYRELRARGLDAQEALLPLIYDPDDGVRVWAASHALEFATKHAQAALQDLAAGSGLSAFTARVTLDEWRKGRLSFP